MKKALVLGAGGFIGNHLVTRLKNEGYWVRGVDLKKPEYQDKSDADDFVVGDLKDVKLVSRVFWHEDKRTMEDIGFDEVYQLAADMGGAGYIFSGENDANVMHNSAVINLNVANEATKTNVGKIFYSSSACMYPEHNQLDPDNPNCEESSAYPANPDSEYGWEKLFSERLYLAYNRNYGLDVRIARFHNIFGPKGTWDGGKEKAPAAMCRKVLKAASDIEIWGDGEQTRSFLYIDECIEGVRRLMESDCLEPVNIGSDEMVTINQLVDIACSIENKSLAKNHIDGPLGVRGRNSDNKFIKEQIGWSPNYPLAKGIEKTYNWIKTQLD
jgi:nucleoside-diphosphate-sugar epimerase|tara:strand:- start:2753 stop:3733 length:981 start_codon:yes stop_codon:yes gene_type:complete